MVFGEGVSEELVFVDNANLWAYATRFAVDKSAVTPVTEAII